MTAHPPMPVRTGPDQRGPTPVEQFGPPAPFLPPVLPPARPAARRTGGLVLSGLAGVAVAALASLLWVVLRVVRTSTVAGSGEPTGVTLDLTYRPSSLVVLGIGGLLLFVVVADVIGFAVANKQYARNRRARADANFVDGANLPDVLPGIPVHRDGG